MPNSNKISSPHTRQTLPRPRDTHSGRQRLKKVRNGQVPGASTGSRSPDLVKVPSFFNAAKNGQRQAPPVGADQEFKIPRARYIRNVRRAGGAGVPRPHSLQTPSPSPLPMPAVTKGGTLQPDRRAPHSTGDLWQQHQARAQDDALRAGYSAQLPRDWSQAPATPPAVIDAHPGGRCGDDDRAHSSHTKAVNTFFSDLKEGMDAKKQRFLDAQEREPRVKRAAPSATDLFSGTEILESHQLADIALDRFCESTPERTRFRESLTKLKGHLGAVEVRDACLALFLCPGNETKYAPWTTALADAIDAYLKVDGDKLDAAGGIFSHVACKEFSRLEEALNNLTAAMGQDTVKSRVVAGKQAAVLDMLERKGYPPTFESLASALGPEAFGALMRLTDSPRGMLRLADTLTELLNPARPPSAGKEDAAPPAPSTAMPAASAPTSQAPIYNNYYNPSYDPNLTNNTNPVNTASPATGSGESSGVNPRRRHNRLADRDVDRSSDDTGGGTPRHRRRVKSEGYQAGRERDASPGTFEPLDAFRRPGSGAIPDPPSDGAAPAADPQVPPSHRSGKLFSFLDIQQPQGLRRAGGPGNRGVHQTIDNEGLHRKPEARKPTPPHSEQPPLLVPPGGGAIPDPPPDGAARTADAQVPRSDRGGKPFSFLDIHQPQGLLRPGSLGHHGRLHTIDNEGLHKNPEEWKFVPPLVPRGAKRVVAPGLYDLAAQRNAVKIDDRPVPSPFDIDLTSDDEKAGSTWRDAPGLYDLAAQRNAVKIDDRPVPSPFDIDLTSDDEKAGSTWRDLPRAYPWLP